jgi:hypothetical protein
MMGKRLRGCLAFAVSERVLCEWLLRVESAATSRTAGSGTTATTATSTPTAMRPAQIRNTDGNEKRQEGNQDRFHDLLRRI